MKTTITSLTVKEGIHTFTVITYGYKEVYVLALNTHTYSVGVGEIYKNIIWDDSSDNGYKILAAMLIKES